MNFSAFMGSLPLREDILDDLTYLQKHLRLIIKFHQKLSSKLYVVSHGPNGGQQVSARTRNFTVVRKLMDELEDEMNDISKEQKMLTDVVKKCMSDYNKTLNEKYNIRVEEDIANGFITRALQHHYEKNYFSIMPSNVKGRHSEEELREKFNQVRGEAESEHNKEDEPNAKTSNKRESLLKPHFRKPASTSSVTNHKRGSTKAPVVADTRRNRGRKAPVKPVAPNTQAIAHGRLNLLKALSKVKTEQVDNKEGLDKYLNERCRATLAEVGEDETNIKYLRSDEDCSDKSSSYDGIEGASDSVEPKRRRRSPTVLNSENSSDGDYMKNYPALPFEPPAKTDYNQEEFLSLFKLITPKVAESLKLRRSERKRRKCAKNERNDYHYGNFDLNEAAYRFRLHNKRSILYSPNVKKVKTER